MRYTLSGDMQHQVVENVLKTYLEEDALNSAVSLWDRQYSGQSFEKLSFFVFEIATTSTLRNLRKDILKELESQLKVETATVAPSPVAAELRLKKPFKSSDRPKYIPSSKELEKSDTREAITIANDHIIEDKIEAKADEVEGEAVVDVAVLSEFIAMLNQMFKDINLSELHEVLDEYLSDEALPLFIKQELYEVVLRNVSLVLLPYDAGHIRQAINVLYSISCEYHGPVKTDRAMMRILSTLESKYPLENLRQFL